jgi:hypothetical protein
MLSKIRKSFNILLVKKLDKFLVLCGTSKEKSLHGNLKLVSELTVHNMVNYDYIYYITSGTD